MGGYDLVALIFAREISDPLTGLVKRIDRRLDGPNALRRGASKLGVFVVVCNDDAGLQERLQALADKEQLKHVVLCAHKSGGPPRYRVAPEADLTVVIYKDSERVAANFPLKKGDLTEDRAAEVLRALTRALPVK